MNKSTTGSLRDNVGKAPVHQVPLELDEAVAFVLYYSSIEGGGKYPKSNWKKGDKHSTPLDSIIRHSKKLANGEHLDKDLKNCEECRAREAGTIARCKNHSWLPHSWHIACNTAFIVYYEKHFPELNDLVGEAEGAEKEPVVADAAQAPAQVSEAPIQESSVQVPNGLVQMLGHLIAAATMAKTQQAGNAQSKHSPTAKLNDYPDILRQTFFVERQASEANAHWQQANIPEAKRNKQ